MTGIDDDLAMLERIVQASPIDAHRAALTRVKSELNRRTEELVAMVYVHPCQCGDGIPQGSCARCRSVKVLGFDPSAWEGEGDGREPDGYRLEGGRMIPTDR